jgi:hypothetical protein
MGSSNINDESDYRQYHEGTIDRKQRKGAGQYPAR